MHEPDIHHVLYNVMNRDITDIGFILDNVLESNLRIALCHYRQAACRQHNRWCSILYRGKMNTVYYVFAQLIYSHLLVQLVQRVLLRQQLLAGYLTWVGRKLR